jgi:hypothetical protein
MSRRSICCTLASWWHEAKSLGKPVDVRVNHEADARFGRSVEGIPKDDIGGLARDAAEGEQFVHRARDLAAEVLDDRAVIAAWMDLALLRKRPMERM